MKDLNRRYSELTKDYYKILNEYGSPENKLSKVPSKNNP